MPEFSKKTVKFINHGMQWNRPVDAIPDDQIAFGRNIRSYEDGTVTTRNGITAFSALGGSYTHSIARLNNSNTTLVGFDFTYIIGQDTKLYVGKTNAILTNGSLNPVKLPPSGSTALFSGNPLTMVDMDPIGSPVGWKYVADSNLMLKAGYYPGDDPTSQMARALTMGMTPPVNTTVPTDGGAGNLVGDYQWIFAYRNKFTGDRSNPSTATRVTLAAPALTLASRYASMTLPTTPLDPQTGSADAHILIDVYRFGGVINDWRYVGTGTSGATFTDDQPDSAILNNPVPPQITDPTTGVTRFNIFRPFITQDSARYSTTNATATQEAKGTWIITAGGADTFNLNWLPGSVIGVNNAIFTIFQVRSSTVVELTEDATGTLASASTYPWATQTGTLTAGEPLPHIWGPFGIGSGGSFIFGCGDTNAAGTLYWTNGNDPDATDVVNSLVVTSPSEPLRTGCIYDGTAFVWSTERLFRIYPSLSSPGQFTVQEVPGGKGILAEWSLTVQSNGVSDQSVSWVGKDGIYDFSNGAGVVSLTDRDLLQFFPHDGKEGNGIGPAVGSANAAGTLLPFLNVNENLPPPDYSQPKYHRLTWFQGELFYDYVGLTSAANNYLTLVYDSKVTKGWVGMDLYFSASATLPISRGIEIAANNLKIGLAGTVYNYTGTDDAGSAIGCRLVTKQDDCGDARGQKLFGDLMFDGDPGGSGAAIGLQVIPRTNYGTTAIASTIFTASGRAQTPVDLSTTGLGLLSKTFGLDVQWTASGAPTVLYQYAFAFVPKPEFTALRATDKTDDGYNGAKYLRGLCIESNTSGSDRTVKVLVDDAVVGTLTVNAADQLELPFAITPAVGSLFQLQPTDANQWELFQVRWVWEKWPDLTATFSAWMAPLNTAKPKYIRGFTMPVDTDGNPVVFVLGFDPDSVDISIPGVTTTASQKTPVHFALPVPIVAHEIQLRPDAACRYWPEEIVWDAEEWPEIASEYYPFQNLGTSQAKYLRSVEVPVETNGLAAGLTLRGDDGTTAIFPPVMTLALVKTAFPFVPTAAPIIAHEFQLISTDPMRVWFGEAKWDFEVWPELSMVVSPWLNAGDPGAKFIQGFVIPLDTNGQPVSFTITYDGGTVTVGPVTTPAGRKTPVPFSFTTPIIAHEFQIAPSAACRCWYEEIKWIWEPIPELTYNWITQETDHDLPGFHYMGPQSFIAYIGGADQPQFTVTTQYGSVTYTLPASNGQYVRAQVAMQPQKAKWRRYSIVSSNGIRLYLRDTSVEVQAWGASGKQPFHSFQPFGEISRAVGARI